MKVFVALLFATLAVASQASYLQSAWPYTNDWNSWNGHQAYPYASGLSAGWPTTSAYGGLYGGHKTVVQANLGHSAYPYAGSVYGGLYGAQKTVVQANLGHNAYAGAWSGAGWPTTSVYGGLYGGQKTVVQANLGHSAYPYAGAWSGAGVYGGLYGGHKTVVQANLGHETAYPWGTYGAGVYGGAWGHHGLAQTVVPVSKQIAATPGSVHVAPVPVGGEKLVVV